MTVLLCLCPQGRDTFFEDQFKLLQKGGMSPPETVMMILMMMAATAIPTARPSEAKTTHGVPSRPRLSASSLSVCVCVCAGVFAGQVTFSEPAKDSFKLKDAFLLEAERVYSLRFHVQKLADQSKVQWKT